MSATTWHEDVKSFQYTGESAQTIEERNDDHNDDDNDFESSSSSSKYNGFAPLSASHLKETEEEEERDFVPAEIHTENNHPDM